MLLVLTPNTPILGSVTLANDAVATPTFGYFVESDSSWGSPSWATSETGARGTHGPRIAKATPGTRTISLHLRVLGSSKDDLADKLSTLQETADAFRRFGGTIVYRAAGQTYRNYLRAHFASATLNAWGSDFENRYEGDVTFSAICAPFADGDAMEIYDSFSANTIGQGLWTFDAGTSADFAIAGGLLTPVSGHLNVAGRLIAGHSGYAYGDVEARCGFYFPLAANPGMLAGVILKRIDASNYVRVYLSDNGATSFLNVDLVVAGVATNFATALGVRTGIGMQWVIGRIEEGRGVIAELWDHAPDAATQPGTVLQAAFPAASPFAGDVLGTVGIYFSAANVGAYADDFAAEPFVYRRGHVFGAGATTGVPWPDRINVCGIVPGDVPARTDVEVGFPTGILPIPVYAGFAWSGRSKPANYVSNGGADAGVYGWSTTAVSGFQNGASSINRIITASLSKYGSSRFYFITPGTLANEGVNYPLYRRFKAGRTYTATAWVRQASGTAIALNLNFGAASANRTNPASSVLVVGTTTPFVQITATWTPTQDEDMAYIGLNVNGTRAGTFEFDGVSVWEGTAAPPALATQAQIEGFGAPPPLGLYAFSHALLSAPTSTGPVAAVTALSGMRQGYAIRTVQANAQAAYSITVVNLVDPSLLAPDDYTEAGIEYRGGSRLAIGNVQAGLVGDYPISEVDVEIFARINLYPAPTVSVLTYIVYGTSFRYTKEYGANAQAITPPQSGYTGRRVRLGTIPMLVSPGQRPWALVTVWSFSAAPGAGGPWAFDLDFLEYLPARRRWTTPSGKKNDATYPTFMPGNTADFVKCVRSDLSTEVTYPPGAGRFPTHGLNGSLCELPPGLVEAYLQLSGTVPGDTSSLIDTDGASEGSVSVRISPRPRYAFLRPISG